MEATLSETYGESVRRRRIAAGLRQLDLSTMANLGDRGLRNIEKGDAAPRESTRSKIESVFGELGMPLADESLNKSIRTGLRDALYSLAIGEYTKARLILEHLLKEVE